MTVKDKITQRLKDIHDPRLLKELLNAVNLEYDIENIDRLSSQEKTAIDEGIADAELGNLHSNEEE